MARSTPRTSYRLTPTLVAAHAGASGIVCLDASAEGRAQPLHPHRPDARDNRRAADVLAEMGGEMGVTPIRATEPPPQNDVLLVCLDGPIEENGGYYSDGACAVGYTAGHDTIYDSLAAAFEIGDVVFCVNSPGGAVAGGPEHMRRAAEMKAKHGRRCIVYARRCNSMAIWWAAAVGDELWCGDDANVGSVGARGMLVSVAGALAKDGITVEVLEDPEGKAAGVPERPISDEAIARAQRDISIAADMFRAAVCASAWGRRAGLTPEILKSYRADAYTGQAAVDAGFADGVSTLEAVMMDALANAGAGESTMPDPNKEPEGDDAPPKKDDAPEEDAAVCKTCKQGKLGAEQRFCGMCGADRVAAPGDDPKDDDAPPDSSARGAALAQKIAASRAPHAPVAAADRLGPTASVPALRAALATASATLDAVARIVGAKTHAEILGSVEAVAKDAARAIRYRAERDEQRKTAETKERIDILLALSARDPQGHPRGKLLADIVDGDKIVGVKPTKLWGDGPEGRTLANLRGYARSTLADAPAAESSPYDRPPVAPVDLNASEPAPGEIEAAKRDPAVKLAARTTPGAKIDDLARNHVLANRAARRATVTA